MRTHNWVVGAMGCAVALSASCSSEPLDSGALASTGSLSAELALGGSVHDVSAVRFDLVEQGASCDAEAIATTTVNLVASAPAGLVDANESEHAFASALFVAAAGSYEVCATPLTADATPSAICAPATTSVLVTSEQTSELLLVSHCAGDTSGGANVAVAFNDPPQIDALTVTESTFITTCESTTLSVAASDPNGDALSYAWSVVSGDGARLRSDQTSATFSAPAAGDFVLQIVVTDAHAASALFQLPIHVESAICELPSAVHEIFVAQCSPCHITNESGRLKLSPPDIGYAALVDHGSSAAACSERVRVIPGDAAASYLIAKLENAPGICGTVMPRGRPALPAAEIETIKAWINGLPH